MRLTHRTIKGVTEDMERFRLNTAISKLMVLTNEMRSALDAGGGARGRGGGARADAGAARAVRRRGAVAGRARERGSVHGSSWPTYDPALAAEDTVTLVVQVDGKVRDKLEVAADIAEARALGWPARPSAGASGRSASARSRKEIVRAPKLVNLVTAR